MRHGYFYLVGAVLALLLSGCGKSGGGSSGVNKDTGSVGVCSAGLVNTQYGCLQQGNCPVGQAQYNNGQCVTAITNQCANGLVSTQYGCLQQGYCPVGQAQYNNQCVQADLNGLNNGYNNGYQYQQQYYNYSGYNPYIPQQNYNSYYMNPFYNPYWNPQLQLQFQLNYGW